MSRTMTPDGMHGGVIGLSGRRTMRTLLTQRMVTLIPTWLNPLRPCRRLRHERRVVHLMGMAINVSLKDRLLHQAGGQLECNLPWLLR